MTSFDAIRSNYVNIKIMIKKVADFTSKLGNFGISRKIVEVLTICASVTLLIENFFQFIIVFFKMNYFLIFLANTLFILVILSMNCFKKLIKPSKTSPFWFKLLKDFTFLSSGSNNIFNSIRSSSDLEPKI